LKKTIVVVGLGNPGKKYAHTRHNIGFMAVQSFAKKHHLSFRKSKELKGSVATGEIGEHSVLLLLPNTYMNRSGESVKAALSQGGGDLLVIVDDVEIPFGQLRMRPHGGTGGHNGLKSIRDLCNTNEYSRLRIGIDRGDDKDLADYVLGEFSSQEKEKIPQILGEVGHSIDLYIAPGREDAMRYANGVKLGIEGEKYEEK